MKLLIDMNLSARWVKRLTEEGIAAVHWSAVGQANAPDTQIMRYAREHEMIVLTHDLDFGAILAATKQPRPSVVQIRAANLSPSVIGPLVIANLKVRAAELEAGALLTIDLESARLVCCHFERRGYSTSKTTPWARGRVLP